MLKIEAIEVYNILSAIRGARNPMNSWNKIDSYQDEKGNVILGDNDKQLLHKLSSLGTDHGKFLRQIFVSMDIIAPLYWWKEFDAYKVGTTSNSTSTMYKLSSTPITKDLFSLDEEDDNFNEYIKYLEVLRNEFIIKKDKKLWRKLIQMLPSNFNQRRTITANYQVLAHMYKARKGHKLSEWQTFREYVEKMPYAKELMLTE